MESYMGNAKAYYQGIPPPGRTYENSLPSTTAGVFTTSAASYYQYGMPAPSQSSLSTRTTSSSRYQPNVTSSHLTSPYSSEGLPYHHLQSPRDFASSSQPAGSSISPYSLGSQNPFQHSYAPTHSRPPDVSRTKGEQRPSVTRSLEVTRVGPPHTFSSISPTEGSQTITSRPNTAHSIVSSSHKSDYRLPPYSSQRQTHSSIPISQRGSSSSSSHVASRYTLSHNSSKTSASSHGAPTLIKAEEPTTLSAAHFQQQQLHGHSKLSGSGSGSSSSSKRFETATAPVPYSVAKQSDDPFFNEKLKESYACIKRVENPYAFSKLPSDSPSSSSQSISGEVEIRKQRNEAYYLKDYNPADYSHMNGIKESRPSSSQQNFNLKDSKKKVLIDENKSDLALDLSVKTVRQTADSTAPEADYNSQRNTSSRSSINSSPRSTTPYNMYNPEKLPPLQSQGAESYLYSKIPRMTPPQFAQLTSQDFNGMPSYSRHPSIKRSSEPSSSWEHMSKSPKLDPSLSVKSKSPYSSVASPYSREQLKASSKHLGINVGDVNTSLIKNEPIYPSAVERLSPYDSRVHGDPYKQWPSFYKTKSPISLTSKTDRISSESDVKELHSAHIKKSLDTRYANPYTTNEPATHGTVHPSLYYHSMDYLSNPNYNRNPSTDKVPNLEYYGSYPPMYNPHDKAKKEKQLKDEKMKIKNSDINPPEMIREIRIKTESEINSCIPSNPFDSSYKSGGLSNYYSSVSTSRASPNTGGPFVQNLKAYDNSTTLEPINSDPYMTGLNKASESISENFKKAIDFTQLDKRLSLLASESKDAESVSRSETVSERQRSSNVQLKETESESRQNNSPFDERKAKSLINDMKETSRSLNTEVINLKRSDLDLNSEGIQAQRRLQEFASNQMLKVVSETIDKELKNDKEIVEVKEADSNKEEFEKGKVLTEESKISDDGKLSKSPSLDVQTKVKEVTKTEITERAQVAVEYKDENLKVQIVNKQVEMTSIDNDQAPIKQLVDNSNVCTENTKGKTTDIIAKKENEKVEEMPLKIDKFCLNKTENEPKSINEASNDLINEKKENKTDDFDMECVRKPEETTAETSVTKDDSLTTLKSNNEVKDKQYNKEEIKCRSSTSSKVPIANSSDKQIELDSKLTCNLPSSDTEKVNESLLKKELAETKKECTIKEEEGITNIESCKMDSVSTKDKDSKTLKAYTPLEKSAMHVESPVNKVEISKTDQKESNMSKNLTDVGESSSDKNVVVTESSCEVARQESKSSRINSTPNSFKERILKKVEESKNEHTEKLKVKDESKISDPIINKSEVTNYTTDKDEDKALSTSKCENISTLETTNSLKENNFEKEVESEKLNVNKTKEMDNAKNFVSGSSDTCKVPQLPEHKGLLGIAQHFKDTKSNLTDKNFTPQDNNDSEALNMSKSLMQSKDELLPPDNLSLAVEHTIQKKLNPNFVPDSLKKNFADQSQNLSLSCKSSKSHVPPPPSTSNKDHYLAARSPFANRPHSVPSHINQSIPPPSHSAPPHSYYPIHHDMKSTENSSQHPYSENDDTSMLSPHSPTHPPPDDTRRHIDNSISENSSKKSIAQTVSQLKEITHIVQTTTSSITTTTISPTTTYPHIIQRQHVSDNTPFGMYNDPMLYNKVAAGHSSFNKDVANQKPHTYESPSKTLSYPSSHYDSYQTMYATNSHSKYQHQGNPFHGSYQQPLQSYSSNDYLPYQSRKKEITASKSNLSSYQSSSEQYATTGPDSGSDTSANSSVSYGSFFSSTYSTPHSLYYTSAANSLPPSKASSSSNAPICHPMPYSTSSIPYSSTSGMYAPRPSSSASSLQQSSIDSSYSQKETSMKSPNSQSDIHKSGLPYEEMKSTYANYSKELASSRVNPCNQIYPTSKTPSVSPRGSRSTTPHSSIPSPCLSRNSSPYHSRHPSPSSYHKDSQQLMGDMNAPINLSSHSNKKSSLSEQDKNNTSHQSLSQLPSAKSPRPSNFSKSPVSGYYPVTSTPTYKDKSPHGTSISQKSPGSGTPYPSKSPLHSHLYISKSPVPGASYPPKSTPNSYYPSSTISRSSYPHHLSYYYPDYNQGAHQVSETHSSSGHSNLESRETNDGKKPSHIPSPNEPLVTSAVTTHSNQNNAFYSNYLPQQQSYHPGYSPKSNLNAMYSSRGINKGNSNNVDDSTSKPYPVSSEQMSNDSIVDSRASLPETLSFKQTKYDTHDLQQIPHSVSSTSPHSVHGNSSSITSLRSVNSNGSKITISSPSKQSYDQSRPVSSHTYSSQHPTNYYPHPTSHHPYYSYPSQSSDISSVSKLPSSPTQQSPYSSSSKYSSTSVPTTNVSSSSVQIAMSSHYANLPSGHDPKQLPSSHYSHRQYPSNSQPYQSSHLPPPPSSHSLPPPSSHHPPPSRHPPPQPSSHPPPPPSSHPPPPLSSHPPPPPSSHPPPSPSNHPPPPPPSSHHPPPPSSHHPPPPSSHHPPTPSHHPPPPSSHHPPPPSSHHPPPPSSHHPPPPSSHHPSPPSSHHPPPPSSHHPPPPSSHHPPPSSSHHPPPSSSHQPPPPSNHPYPPPPSSHHTPPSNQHPSSFSHRLYPTNTQHYQSAHLPPPPSSSHPLPSPSSHPLPSPSSHPLPPPSHHPPPSSSHPLPPPSHHPLPSHHPSQPPPSHYHPTPPSSHHPHASPSSHRHPPPPSSHPPPPPSSNHPLPPSGYHHSSMPSSHHPSTPSHHPPPPSSHHPHAPPSSHHSHAPPSSHHPHAPPSSHHPHAPPSSHHPHAPPSSHHSHAPPSSHHPLPPPSSHHSHAPSSGHHSTPPSTHHPLPPPSHHPPPSNNHSQSFSHSLYPPNSHSYQSGHLPPPPSSHPLPSPPVSYHPSASSSHHLAHSLSHSSPPLSNHVNPPQSRSSHIPSTHVPSCSHQFNKSQSSHYSETDAPMKTYNSSNSPYASNSSLSSIHPPYTSYNSSQPVSQSSSTQSNKVITNPNSSHQSYRQDAHSMFPGHPSSDGKLPIHYSNHSKQNAIKNQTLKNSSLAAHNLAHPYTAPSISSHSPSLQTHNAYPANAQKSYQSSDSTSDLSVSNLKSLPVKEIDQKHSSQSNVSDKINTQSHPLSDVKPSVENLASNNSGSTEQEKSALVEKLQKKQIKKETDDASKNHESSSTFMEDEEIDWKFDKLMDDLACHKDSVTSKKSCILGRRYNQKVQLQYAVDNNEVIVPETYIEEEESESEREEPIKKFRGKFKSIKDKAVERVILTYASHSDESATEMIPDEDASDFEEELKKEIRAKDRKGKLRGKVRKQRESSNESKKHDYRRRSASFKEKRKVKRDEDYTLSSSYNSSSSRSSSSSDDNSNSSDSSMSSSSDFSSMTNKRKNVTRKRRRGRTRSSSNSDEDFLPKRKTRRSKKLPSEDESFSLSRNRKGKRPTKKSLDGKRKLRKRLKGDETDDEEEEEFVKNSVGKRRKKGKREEENDDSDSDDNISSSNLSTAKRKKGTLKMKIMKNKSNISSSESEKEEKLSKSKLISDSDEIFVPTKTKNVKMTIIDSESDLEDTADGLKKNDFEMVAKEELKSQISFLTNNELLENNNNDSVLIKLNKIKLEELSRDDVVEMKNWRELATCEMNKLLVELPETKWRHSWKKPFFGGDEFKKGWQTEVKKYKTDMARIPKSLVSTPPPPAHNNSSGIDKSLTPQKKVKEGVKKGKANKSSFPAKNTRGKTGIVKTSLSVIANDRLKVPARPVISNLMEKFFEKVLGDEDSPSPEPSKKFPTFEPFTPTSRSPTGLTPTPSLALSLIASDDSDRDSLASLRTDLPASDSVPVAPRRSSIANSLIKKLRKKYKEKIPDAQWLNKSRAIMTPSNKPSLLPTPGLSTDNEDSHSPAQPNQLRMSTFFRKDSVNRYRETFDDVVFKNGINEFTPVLVPSRTRNKSKAILDAATIKAVFGDEPPLVPSPSKDKLKRSKNDATAKIKGSNNKKSSLLQELKTKDVRELALSGSMMIKSQSPVPSSVSQSSTPVEFLYNDDEDSEIRSERSEPTLRELAIMQGIKSRKKLRKFRKFRSGFDYIRKKTTKKVKTEEELLHSSKRRMPVRKRMVWPEENKDIANEIKGWVINKGLGETVLHKAARLQYHDVVMYCLESSDFNVNWKDNAGYTPLHEACNRGHLDIAQALCAHHAHVNASGFGGMRPLHEAIENGHIELARLLLAYGADPSLSTYGGQSCLALASDSQTERFVNEFLADLRGKRVQPWHILGPSKIFDLSEQGSDIFANLPMSPAKRLSSISPSSSVVKVESQISDEDDELLPEMSFEASDRMLPNIYTIDDREGTFLLARELFDHLSMTETELIKTIGQIATVYLNWKECDVKLRCLVIGSKEHLKREVVKGVVTLIEYSEAIKELLNVEITEVR